ncbi:Flagellar protein FliS [compost metagenome]
MRILEEGLKGALNPVQGGELAVNLGTLYDYCITRLTMANLRNDLALVEEVVGLIEPVAQGWKEMGQAQVDSGGGGY